MKKIGFIGAYDKSDFIMHVAKVLEQLGHSVLVIDTCIMQKTKYIVPSINPTKSYITNFENIDFAIGFESWEDIEKYLGIKFDTNDEKKEEDSKTTYDYILIDVDDTKMFENFNIRQADKNYFVTAFDSYSLKKGIMLFDTVGLPIKLTKILFSYEPTKEEEEYLDFLSLDYRINWSDFTVYFQIQTEDIKAIYENQKLERIRFKKLSNNYKDSLSYVIQDIDKSQSIGKIKKMMKE